MIEQLSQSDNKRSLVAAPRARTAVKLSAALALPGLELETPAHQAALAIRAQVLSLKVANNERSAGRTEVNEMTSRGFINSLFGRSGSFANRRRQRTGSFSSRPSSAMGFVDQPDAPVLLLLWL